jgi:aryl-alcohol dehydrogenase-like predicted oxidoreductase
VQEVGLNHQESQPVGGSKLGLGCASLGSSGRDGVRLVHHALDHGVGFFDTADAYGKGGSERVLGRALKGRRDEAFVATKGGYLFKERSALTNAGLVAARHAVDRSRRHRAPAVSGPAVSGPALARPPRASSYGRQDFSPAYLRRALEGSLRRIGTDFIDLYQLHGPDAVDEDVTALMHDLTAEGKIRGFGVALEALGPAGEWLRTGSLSSVQAPFGVLDPQAAETVIPQAAARGISVVVRGVPDGGFGGKEGPHDDPRLRPGQSDTLRDLARLASSSGVDRKQLAVWYALACPGVTTVLIGTSTEAHLSEAIRYAAAAAPEQLMQRLSDLVAAGSGGPASSSTGSRNRSASLER